MPHRPGLLLYVPGDWDADPAALAELRRHLSDEYGATLEVRQACGPMAGLLTFYPGAWGRSVEDELRPWIEAAFFNLDWIEETA